MKEAKKSIKSQLKYFMKTGENFHELFRLKRQRAQPIPLINLLQSGVSSVSLLHLLKIRPLLKITESSQLKMLLLGHVLRIMKIK